jgi:hypothetical protein
MKPDLSEAKTALEIGEQMNGILKALRPYKPETKGLRIDYREKTSDISLCLNIPDTIKRKVRDVELPAYSGYKIYEMYDESLNRVDCCVEFKDGKWVIHADKLPASEKFLVIMKGAVKKDALERLVKLHAPEDPKREGNLEKYWIHSAIKDMQILKQIWEELEIERINVDVHVGVERYFTSAIPSQITMMLHARGKLLKAIESGVRERFRLESQYRYWSKKARISTGEIYDIIRSLSSGEAFADFIDVDHPYEISSIEPTSYAFLVPEKVGIGVQTDLGFQRPAADGCLSFKKDDFSSAITKAFKRFIRK